MLKDWELLETLPDGWYLDETTGSPLTGYSFCRSTKSRFDPAYKQALVRAEKPKLLVEPKQLEFPKQKDTKAKQNNNQVIDENYVKTVNTLAREKFKLKIMQEIMFDLMVCEIEGWSKKEYIEEITTLVGSLGKG